MLAETPLNDCSSYAVICCWQTLQARDHWVMVDEKRAEFDKAKEMLDTAKKLLDAARADAAREEGPFK